MIHFEGVESFPTPPADLYAKLADAGWLAKSLPDTEVLEATADRATWKVKPKFAFMAGTLDTVAEVTARTPVEQVRYRVTSTSVGAKSVAEASLTVKPAGDGSEVHWSGDLTELAGLLKMVPRGLLQAAAQKVIADVWVALKQKVAG
jgi:carbon monoxide dehydrogenase subunit G